MTAEVHQMPVSEREGPAAPPANYEIEQALLAMILGQNRHYDTVLDAGLGTDHFDDGLHARIFEACGKLIDAGKTASALTLAPMFPDDHAGPEQTVRQYLAELQRASSHIAGWAKDYAELLIDLWQRREALALLDEVSDDIVQLDGERTASDILEEAAGQIMELHDGPSATGGACSLSDAMGAWMVDVEAAHKAGGVLGVSTGFTDIDEQLGGLVKTDLIILAGRPGMGKTALAMGMALNVARAGGHVLFASYEMSERQLSGRVMAGEAGVPVTVQRRGQANSHQFDQLFEAQRSLAALPLWLEAPRIKTVAALRARARQMKRKVGLGLIMVDYLQLMSGQGFKRYEEVSAISRDLKALAIGLDVPVLALSQLSRQVEGRDDKRPQLSDLRETGALEQDADVVMFVYREIEYLKNAEPKRRHNEADDVFNGRRAAWETQKLDLAGVAEVLIRKNRHGPTADVRLAFDGARTMFSDIFRGLV